jgi:hypothetical protein
MNASRMRRISRNPLRFYPRGVAPDMPEAIQSILTECPCCHCRDLFVRKNFPQKLGLTIVVLAGVAFLFLAANPTTFHLGVYILLIPVVIDGLLYFFVGKLTVCYRCRAEFAGPTNPDHHGFDLATGEKYRSVSSITKG